MRSLGLTVIKLGKAVNYGVLAQLGERLLCKQEVKGSNPLCSIVHKKLFKCTIALALAFWDSSSSTSLSANASATDMSA